MGLPVLIYGKSGSGKSRSLKFFDEDEIVLLNHGVLESVDSRTTDSREFRERIIEALKEEGNE